MRAVRASCNKGQYNSVIGCWVCAPTRIIGRSPPIFHFKTHVCPALALRPMLAKHSPQITMIRDMAMRREKRTTPSSGRNPILGTVISCIFGGGPLSGNDS